MVGNIISREIKILGKIIVKFPRLMSFNCFRTGGYTIEYKKAAAEGREKGRIMEILFAIIGRAIGALFITLPTNFVINIIKTFKNNGIIVGETNSQIAIIFVITFVIIMYISLRIILMEYNEVINYKTKQTRRKKYLL